MVAVCRELNALRQSIKSYAAGFDAAALTPSQAGAIVQVCAQIEASVAGLKALAAARCAEGNDWKLEGYRSAADHLARQTGSSPGQAKRTLETGHRMSLLPEVAEAALAGDLSAEQAAAVSDGAAANPSKAGSLIEKARRGSLTELNEEVARTKAEVTDQEARRQAIHAKRSFKRWTDRDGACQAHLYGNPEQGIKLWQMLDPIRRRLTMLRKGKTPNDSLPALDFDALMTVAALANGDQAELTLADLIDLGLFPQFDAVARPEADDGTPPKRTKKLAGSPARVMVRVDLDALLRGVAIEGELCEILGYGPVPVSAIEDLLANGNTFLVGLLTKSKQLVGVRHFGRYPNAHQKSALDFLYPTCAALGCSARAGLQSDHRLDWRSTHFTVWDLLDRLCPHHHRLKTSKGWALVAGSGKRAFVRPDDSRHPGHRVAQRE